MEGVCARLTRTALNPLLASTAVQEMAPANRAGGALNEEWVLGVLDLTRFCICSQEWGANAPLYRKITGNSSIRGPGGPTCIFDRPGRSGRACYFCGDATENHRQIIFELENTANEAAL
jgi:hypothetical protein